MTEVLVTLDHPSLFVQCVGSGNSHHVELYVHMVRLGFLTAPVKH